MKRADLYAELTSIRRSVREATVHFDALADGLDHPRLETVRQRLTTADASVRSAAGGLSLVTRTSIDVVVLMAVGWTTASLAGALLGPGWTITVTVIVLLACFRPLVALLNRLARHANERRTRSDGSAPASTDVLPLLESARIATQQTMHRWLGSHRLKAAAGSPSGLRWLAEQDATVGSLRQLEISLCQAIDSLQIWQADTTGDR
ncbi:MAG: hypothetical protein HOV78_02985 [Hamadaea sp.]|nr:hypothetical protein [Hamadaea sp.]NUT06245.1 hypothetical protein [Hamadaea sp.]